MKTKKSKKDSLILKLIDGDRHKHRVALVTDEGEWNQHEPNTGMARMFVVMLLIHVVLIGGIIVYDFMGEEEAPAQVVTQAARAHASSSGLPQASEEVINAQANAVANPDANTEQYTVSSGDSIRSIAERHNTTEEKIIEMNRLDKGIQIEPGTLLSVPKTIVPAAVAIDRATALAMTTRQSPPETQGEPVKPADAPASISAAATPMSLLAPGEASPIGNSLSAAAEAPAIAAPATEDGPAQQIIGRVNPEAMAVLASAAEENEKVIAAAEKAASMPSEPDAKPQPRPEPKPEPKKVVAKPEPKPESKPLAKPNPVPTPSQMVKRLADAPPAPKATTKKSTTKDTPPKPAVAKTTTKSHTLAAGETLYRLASRYGVSVAAIQKANNIKNPNSMREGMKLVIPAK